MDDPAVKISPVKRRDMGIAGAIVILAQVLSTFQSSQNVATEIVKFKEEFQQSLIERNLYFARKTDIAVLSERIEHMHSELLSLKIQIQSLKNDVVAQDDIVGCSHRLAGNRL